MDYTATALYTVRFGKDTATMAVTASGKYPNDSVARMKLTWKCMDAARKEYGGRNVVGEKEVKFYAVDGNERVEIR